MFALLTLNDLQRIKQWHVQNKYQHPIEYHLLDAVLTCWLMGWVGWLPALMFDAEWAFPLCMLAMHLPSCYVYSRTIAHQRQRVRCDWLDTVRQSSR
ncbi:hypothetical protein [Variovorax sp. HJSM1_2]|uniref:hypothetical protein n=1 Tax=Variovorax sp. HJSM1_2 TaxID=3366263 RepID=UPI003BD6725C